MTGWKPRQLLKVVDFCYNIDKDAPDHFKFLKEIGKFPEELQKEDMNDEQLNMYTEVVEKYKQ